MIKPNEVTFASRPNLRLDRLEQLSTQFDRTIRLAEKSGEWPAVATVLRDDVNHDEIVHMIEQYRVAGWIVVKGARGSGVLATIDHPNRTPVAR